MGLICNKRYTKAYNYIYERATMWFYKSLESLSSKGTMLEGKTNILYGVAVTTLVPIIPCLCEVQRSDSLFT